MNTYIQFDRFECGELTMYHVKDGGWQLSNELGLHKCSPARDYLVKWFQYDGKWSLHIANYNNTHFTYNVNNLILTVDTLCDLFDYISENRYIHY
jgi:hypothetical protein